MVCVPFTHADSAEIDSSTIYNAMDTNVVNAVTMFMHSAHPKSRTLFSWLLKEFIAHPISITAAIFMMENEE